MAQLTRRKPPKNKINDWLIKYSRNVKSQSGEDGVIEKIFDLIELDYPQPKKKPRTIVEIGAWDGVHLSNSWNLVHNHGWNAVLVEAQKDRFQQLQELYRGKEHRITCVNKAVSFEGKQSLEYILENARLPTNDLDLLVIDVDGADYWLWESLKKYRPKVVCIEFNPTIPNHIFFAQEKSMKVFQGSSLRALVELGKNKHYELVSTTTYNAFFVDERFFKIFQIKDNDLYKMHDTPMPTDIFQLYDGQLVLAGCKKLIWHRMKIDQENIQVLPKERRSYPFAPQVRVQMPAPGGGLQVNAAQVESPPSCETQVYRRPQRRPKRPQMFNNQEESSTSLSPNSYMDKQIREEPYFRYTDAKDGPDLMPLEAQARMISSQSRTTATDSPRNIESPRSAGMSEKAGEEVIDKNWKDVSCSGIKFENIIDQDFKKSEKASDEKMASASLERSPRRRRKRKILSKNNDSDGFIGLVAGIVIGFFLGLMTSSFGRKRKL